MRSRFPAIVTALAGCWLASHTAAAPVINEIMYRPGTAYPENPDLEFIELYNPDAAAVDLSGWAIRQGPDFTFPAGTSIAAGGYLVVAANPSTLASAGGYSGALGPWASGSHLSDNGETVSLAQPDGSGGWTTIDAVDYADEGDFAVRTRDTLGGWSWVSAANSGGCSLERRNPALARNSGQNWGASTAAGGTPGRVNSRYAADVAPLITGVQHAPAVPTSADTVTISCHLTDEKSADQLTATLYWRNATATSPGAFQSVAMVGDGTGGFSAPLAKLAAKQIVEFYVSASDGTNTRTWPAPNSEGQTTNCTYQVDDEVYTGTAPMYRLVLTAAENAAFTSLASSNPQSDRQFNFTLVVSRGADTTIRYLSSMRIRGNSSRQYTFKPLHINLPTDNLWDGVSSFNLNPKAAWLQFLAMRLQQAAGLVAANTTPVELRRQGLESTTSTSAIGDYGCWVRVEDFNGAYVRQHWPTATAGQVYRKTAVSAWNSTGTAPANPDTTWQGWSKQSDHGLNDWTDVMGFCASWQNACAAHFSGATTGNVAAGTWINGSGFTDSEMTQLSQIVDLDYTARWFAVMTILLNNEPNLSTGEDDDYAAAFINDGTHTRMYLIPHDMDTILGTGDGSVSATAVNLYDATETDTVQRAGVGPVTLMKPLLPLLGNSSYSGNAAFRAKYYAAIRELYGSVFDADTSTTANPAFYQLVDNYLGNWVPASVRTQVKTFMTQRQAYLLGLIGAAKTPPATATSTATRAADATPTVRLNEILAGNTSTYANGATHPDIIELYNSGSAPVDLAGLRLGDYTAPTAYTFPAGTTIAAGGYLLVLADSDTTTAGLHTGFALDAEGDAVYLYDTAASGGALLDGIEFGFQIADQSISRTASAPGTWALTAPTLGAANGDALPLGSVAGVSLNEWAGNIDFRTDKDFVELYNPAALPVALGGVSVTDDLLTQPRRYDFRKLSFIPAGGFLLLDTDKLEYGLDGDFDNVFLRGENGTVIDRVSCVSQAADGSAGRTTDGATTWTTFKIPTPGLSNTTTLPAAYQALLDYLRISEIMYQPLAASSAGSYEYVELLNTGTSPLDLGGVRFTNGIDYTFAAGTTLAAGEYLVVCKNRSAFLSRYPTATGKLAAGTFSGALDNSGETLALTLPAPWAVHILRFRYEASWYPTTAGGGYSLAARTPATTAARDWAKKATWTASPTIQGNPGYDNSIVPTTIVAVPTSTTVCHGTAATFGVTLSGVAVISCQWQYSTDGGLNWANATDGTLFAGATTAVLTVLAPSSALSGCQFRCAISEGSTLLLTTDAVTLTVGWSQFAALSARAPVGTGDQVLFLGFVFAGGGKPTMIRGVGPGLVKGDATLAGQELADPQLTLNELQTVNGVAQFVALATNDNWGGAEEIRTKMSALGMGALDDTSADAVMLTTPTRAVYTAQISGANQTTGLALAEVYDANFSDKAKRLTALSIRNQVGAGSSMLIAGLVITGDAPKKVLLRGVGPGLVPTVAAALVLANPTLQLNKWNLTTKTWEVVGTNDDWGGSAELATAMSTAGMGALATDSKDAVLLLDLPPGIYTAQLSGVGETTGIGLVEIYEAP